MTIGSTRQGSWCVLRNFLARLFVVASALASATGVVQAQDSYPSRFVRIIVPFAAGTSPDVVIRLVGQKLGDMWGKPVVVENRPGAAGSIGANAVATSAPDGYTLLYTINSVICANPHLYSKLSYDPFKSFVPVSLVANLGYVLVGRSDLPASNLQELLALAKAQPGKLTFTSAGEGAGNHIVMELLTSMAGVSMLHVPMSGSSQTAVMSGQVDLVMNPYTTGVPMAKAGKVRVYGVTLAQRVQSLPDVPAIGEVLNGYVGDAWHGLLAPAGTPAPIVDKLSADIAKVLAMPDVRQRLIDIGLEPIGSTPSQFAAVTRSDYEKWGKVIRGAKIKLD